MRSRGIKFLRQILFDELLQASLCPAGELAQILRKRANVQVILLGVEAERFFGERSAHPRLVKWMFQQVVFFDECIKRRKQNSVAVLGQVVLLIFRMIGWVKSREW